MNNQIDTGEGQGPGGRRFFPRPRICPFCSEKNMKIDYKQQDVLRKFVTDDGKIRLAGRPEFAQGTREPWPQRSSVLATSPCCPIPERYCDNRIQTGAYQECPVVHSPLFRATQTAAGLDIQV